MIFFKSLPATVSLLLLLVIEPPPISAKLVPLVIKKIHHSAVHRTHNLARDLRVAFGGALASRAVPAKASNRVVYCKPGKQGVLGGGHSSGGGNTTSSVGTSRGTATSTKTTATASPTTTSPSSPWKVAASFAGNNFFDGWDFFTGSDPTQGIVTYVDENTARSSGLLEINSAGNAVMRVETTPTVSANRQSVRITTQYQYTGGLLVMDSVHMPTGCGIWPAFWSNGPNWPAGGEIDIIEGVNDYTNNQATIHTNVGCTIASTSSATLAISGSVIGGTNCAALTTGNQGCGIRSNSATSYGPGFNANNGGVYAMKWDSTGIAVYFFPRTSIPADITAGAPLPDTWGAAQARWPAASCAPFSFFNNHQAIFDTTLCGDWAAAVWSSTGIPGQEQSCAQRTGSATCEAFVRANGASMAQAYWEIKNLTIYRLQN